MTNRSMSIPMAVTVTTVRAMTTMSGRWVVERMEAPSMPPSMANSPCAKLTAPVALKMMLSPSAMRP